RTPGSWKTCDGVRDRPGHARRRRCRAVAHVMGTDRPAEGAVGISSWRKEVCDAVRNGGRSEAVAFRLAAFVVRPHPGGVTGELDVVDGKGEIPGYLLDHLGGAHPPSGPLAVVVHRDRRGVGGERLGFDVELNAAA